jgi:hypothetical protein
MSTALALGVPVCRCVVPPFCPCQQSPQVVLRLQGYSHLLREARASSEPYTCTSSSSCVALALVVQRASASTSTLHAVVLVSLTLRVQASIVPPIVSHGYGSGFASGFVWDGCRDYSGVLVVPAILRFWEHVDLAAARSYCRQLLVDACALLCEASQLFALLSQYVVHSYLLAEVPLHGINLLTSMNSSASMSLHACAGLYVLLFVWNHVCVRLGL